MERYDGARCTIGFVAVGCELGKMAKCVASLEARSDLKACSVFCDAAGNS